MYWQLPIPQAWHLPPTTNLLNELIPICSDVPIVLHLHDKNGVGLANMNVALMSGIRHFDTSIAGLGGCTFVPGAFGNIDTIKAVNILKNRGIETGLDMTILQQCKDSLLSFLEKNHLTKGPATCSM